MKKVIRLTESDIHNIIKKSVNKILREFGSDGPDFEEMPYDGNYNEYYDRGRFSPHVNSASDIDDFDNLGMEESKRRMSKIIKESIRKVMREASVYPDYDSTTTADIADNGGGNIITCYGNPGVINGKYQGGGVGTILGSGVIYLSCNPPSRGMTSMYGQLVPVKVDVSNFYRAKDAWEAKKLIGLVGFKDEYSGILYHGNRDGDVCAVFDRSCIIG